MINSCSTVLLLLVLQGEIGFRGLTEAFSHSESQEKLIRGVEPCYLWIYAEKSVLQA